MKRRPNAAALYRALMRACYRAEVLAGKCARLGVNDTGLEHAAREFRHAADRVAVEVARGQNEKA